MREPRVEIARDPQDLAERMAQLFVATAERAIVSRGAFHTAFSGGRTPELFLQRLASDPRARALDWERAHVFWADERFVPPDSQASNYRLVAETFLSRISIPEANVHPIPTQYENMNDAAVAYERTMREVFGLREGEVPQFDLIVLGMGRDAHTASLFPDSPAIHETDCLACVVQASGDVKLDRITLTPPVLLAARRLSVLVSGREKAQTLHEVLTSAPNERRYPIHVLWPILEQVTWLVDRDAMGRSL